MPAAPFNKVVGLQDFNILKKRLQHRIFPVNIAELLRTCILSNICERLLLNLQYDFCIYSGMLPPQGSHTFGSVVLSYDLNSF